mmetsp:Transcript_59883/g.106501  ORF Transcript_59883/g.106501 Transcript_59883/m.106501 type:complete len:237 (+) Transcript_59883:1825-2535(+)
MVRRKVRGQRVLFLHLDLAQPARCLLRTRKNSLVSQPLLLGLETCAAEATFPFPRQKERRKNLHAARATFQASRSQSQRLPCEAGATFLGSQSRSNHLPYAAGATSHLEGVEEFRCHWRTVKKLRKIFYLHHSQRRQYAAGATFLGSQSQNPVQHRPCAAKATSLVSQSQSLRRPCAAEAIFLQRSLGAEATCQWTSKSKPMFKQWKWTPWIDELAELSPCLSTVWADVKTQKCFT